jgi:glycosyltransferase involved in cell wall biosynthesis
VKNITIGLPCYDDYEGVYFSVQALRMYHSDVISTDNILIVDNNPSSSQGKATRQFARSQKIKYIVNDKSHGPSNSKNEVFNNADTDYVVCMDSHVFLEMGSLSKLMEYYDKNPKTQDLLHGPLLYDDLESVSTHFDPEWRGDMWGKWATNDIGKDPMAEPFEIPAQGMGLFSCRKDAWLGFNENFAGFGGEECYIHEKFRQSGRKVWCLPFLRWVHRFNRPLGVKYPLVLEDRIRNYIIGHQELDLPIENVVNHFNKVHPNINIQKIINNLDEVPSESIAALKEESVDNPKPVNQVHDNVKLWDNSDINFTGQTLFRYIKYEITRSYDGYASLRQVKTIPDLPDTSKIHYVSSESTTHPAASVLGDGGSWVTSDDSQGKMPHKLIIDFGKLFSPTQISTLPRHGLNQGIPVEFKIFCSQDLESWDEISHVNILDG